ncbi:MAG TPA: hypothetical protein VHL80_13295 [Polyangia bacterium]|nr:hypothetical protein [Polyangia bacterium]
MALASGGAARGANNDLHLLNLCDFGGATECPWVMRAPNGAITAPVGPDADGQARFRSLMSELGVVIAPRLQTPADTLGYAGFQFSAELGVTKINSDRSYWNGVASVDPTNPNAGRPSSYLTTVGGFVRKGMWFPLPAFEFGAGALSILGSNMYVLQGYAKLALQEGFHGWWLPSFAVRGSASQLLGTDQVDLNVYGLDVLISKAFGLAGTSRLEPFLGWNVLWIDAQSGVIDATPSCDAFAAHQAMATTDPDKTPKGCQPAQTGTWNDTLANFTFPQQSVITRYRWSGGFKLKMSVLFLVGEYDFIQAGKSRDSKQPEAVRDGSGSQQSFSLSAGFDF